MALLQFIKYDVSQAIHVEFAESATAIGADTILVSDTSKIIGMVVYKMENDTIRLLSLHANSRSWDIVRQFYKHVQREKNVTGMTAMVEFDDVEWYEILGFKLTSRDRDLAHMIYVNNDRI